MTGARAGAGVSQVDGGMSRPGSASTIRRSGAPAGVARNLRRFRLRTVTRVQQLYPGASNAPEHDPEKWMPVFGKRSCSANKASLHLHAGRFDDAAVAREVARDACLELVERGEIRLARAGLRQIGLRATTALSPRIPRLHRGAPIPRCSVHIGARCWDRTTKMGSFHAPICPKPARTLSRKDWHSSANGAVV